jgi:hypothetical protein
MLQCHPVDVVGFRPIIPVPSEGVLVTAVLSVFCNILIGFSRFSRFLDLLEQHLLEYPHF